jgi:hypothetical protein
MDICGITVVPDELVPKRNNSSYDHEKGLAGAVANPGSWVVWATDLPSAERARDLAAALRTGRTARLLTKDKDLEFQAWTNKETGVYNVIARYTPSV